MISSDVSVEIVLIKSQFLLLKYFLFPKQTDEELRSEDDSRNANYRFLIFSLSIVAQCFEMLSPDDEDIVFSCLFFDKQMSFTSEVLDHLIRRHRKPNI